MTLMDYGRAENDAGEWVDYEEAEGRVSRLRIRPIPPEVERQIAIDHGAHRTRVARKLQKGFPRRRQEDVEVEFVFDQEVIHKVNADRACFALVDVEHRDVIPGDEEAAALYRKWLNDPEVAPGKPVRLDGRLNTQVKKRLFSRLPDLQDFVLDMAAEMRDAAHERERGLSGN